MTEGDRNRAIIAEVVARGWRDQAYLDRLKKNPKAALLEAGMVIPASMEVVLLENTGTVINAILPPKSDMPKYQAVIQKAVQMLADLPDDIEVRLNRETATRSFFILPVKPASGGELSDADLEQVAGGKGDVTVNVNNVANVTNAVNLAEAAVQVVGIQTVAGVTTVAGVAEVAAAVAAVVVPCFIS
jgi:hypothetical protein